MADPRYMKAVRAHFPSKAKKLRACKRCKLLMNETQFFELGCSNCPELLMQDNKLRCGACTTEKFDGFIAHIGQGGFVSRFTGLENRFPGFYALTVRDDEIPAEFFSYEERKNLKTAADELCGDRPSPRLMAAYVMESGTGYSHSQSQLGSSGRWLLDAPKVTPK